MLTLIAMLSTVVDQMKEKQPNEAHLFVSLGGYGIIWDDGDGNCHKMAFTPSFMSMGDL
jgi:hypothetical protein